MNIWKKLSNQRGAVAILVALSAVVLIGFAALAIDIGYALVATNQLHNAADAGALAGARSLGKFYCPETDPANPCKSKADQDDTTIAEVEISIKTAVKNVVNQNKAANSSILIDDGDIEIGTWDGKTQTFTANATPPDAVRVRTRRDETTNGPIPTFLGNIFGVASLNMSKPATAALTGIAQVEEDEITIPLGVSANRECTSPDTITLGGTNDCAAWSSFDDPKGDNANKLKQLIDDIRIGVPNKVPDAGIGDSFEYNNGVQGTIFNALYNLYMAKRDPDTREWVVLMPVYVDPGPGCTPANDSREIVGFATMKFVDVNPSDPSDDPIGCTATQMDEPHQTCPRNVNELRGNLVCRIEPGRGGGSDKWSIGSIPGLVQ
jgi:Flp pilus assembly protein TadG